MFNSHCTGSGIARIQTPVCVIGEPTLPKYGSVLDFTINAHSLKHHENER